ncbi:unnamed protein product [Cochlearia groenlandica]
MRASNQFAIFFFFYHRRIVFILVSGINRELSPAISRPLIFDPISSTWRFVPLIGSPRRWCSVGSCDGVIYVASCTDSA